MRLGALHVRFDACDLRLQRFDALFQLLDRHRIKVLAAKLDEGIAGLAWEEIFQVHGANR